MVKEVKYVALYRRTHSWEQQQKAIQLQSLRKYFSVFMVVRGWIIRMGGALHHRAARVTEE